MQQIYYNFNQEYEENPRVPIKIKWFEERGEKVVDFELSEFTCIIETKDQESVSHFYAMNLIPEDFFEEPIPV